MPQKLPLYEAIQAAIKARAPTIPVRPAMVCRVGDHFFIFIFQKYNNRPLLF